MKKVIVTGANGFLGTALCKELSDRGITVIAVVRSKESDISGINKLRGLTIIYSDMADIHNLPNLICDRDIDVMYHFAWEGTAGDLRGDYLVQLNNVRYTCDAVKTSAELGCKRFVFASSIMEYEVEATMATEETPRINTLYCSAKVSADYFARTLAGKFGLEYIRAVISNVYGPGEVSPRLINTSLRKMLNGEHCSFSAGDQMYDFIYLSDAAKSFCEIGEKGSSNRTYYIGSQEPRSLKLFLTDMRDCVDPDIQLGLGELPFSGPELTYREFDINAVQNDTGFIPEVSFKQGINNTIEWLRENG